MFSTEGNSGLTRQGKPGTERGRLPLADAEISSKLEGRQVGPDPVLVLSVPLTPAAGEGKGTQG